MYPFIHALYNEWGVKNALFHLMSIYYFPSLDNTEKLGIRKEIRNKNGPNKLVFHPSRLERLARDKRSSLLAHS
jgi:hypothetical protein